MSYELLLLRHAKSGWDIGGARDFNRPLAARGRRDAPLIGKWLSGQGLVPDVVVSSPAVRAMQTIQVVCETLAIPQDSIRQDERIYLAELSTLLEVLASIPSGPHRVLLTGHNPGMDQLLIHLCGPDLPRTASGKLMTTAALARIELPDGWQRLPAGCGRLLQLVRPRDLERRQG